MSHSLVSTVLLGSQFPLTDIVFSCQAFYVNVHPLHFLLIFLGSLLGSWWECNNKVKGWKPQRRFLGETPMGPADISRVFWQHRQKGDSSVHERSCNQRMTMCHMWTVNALQDPINMWGVNCPLVLCPQDRWYKRWRSNCKDTLYFLRIFTIMLCCFCTLIFREVFLRDALKTFLRDYLGIFPNMGRGVFPIPKTCYTKQNSPLINKIKKKINQNFVFEQGGPPPSHVALEVMGVTHSVSQW